jgi:hypothetical protein
LLVVLVCLVVLVLMSDKVLRKLEAIVTSAVQSGLIPFNERLQLVHEQVQEVRDNLNNRRGIIGERQIALARSLNIDITVQMVFIFLFILN